MEMRARPRCHEADIVRAEGRPGSSRYGDRLDRTRFEPVFGNFRDANLPFADFDCVVPLRLADYPPLRAHQGQRINALIPSRPVVDLTDDKPRFNAFLADNRFGHLVPDLDDGVVTYPFIYKKRRDRAGQNSRIIFSPDELADFESGIDKGDYFRQRYVGGGREYTTHFLAVNGRTVFDTTVEFSFDEAHYVRGIHFEPTATTKVDTPFIAVFGEIVAALGYNGTCCFNYKIEQDAPIIFEVNPRCGGSLRLDLDAYIDAYLTALRGRLAI